MIVAFVSALGPLLGGFLADFFSTRSFVWNVQWNGVHGTSVIHLLELQNWNFLFIIGGLLAIAALRTLGKVKEEGEVEKDVAVAQMRVVFRNKVKTRMNKESILSMLLFPVTYPIRLKKKVISRIERRVVSIRKWNGNLVERKRA